MSTIRPVLNRLPRQAVFVAIMLLLLGCRSTDVPTVQPSPTAEPTLQAEAPVPADEATPSPAEAPIVIAERQPIYFGAAGELTIDLPPDWESAVLDAAAIRTQLSESDPPAQTDPATSTFLDGTNDTTSVIVATFTGDVADPAVRPVLTVTVIPRHEIRLDQYVEGLAGRLSSTADVEVERAGLLYDIREDGLPVGMLAYHRAKPGGADLLSAYHLAQFDEEGDNLVTMTWVGTPADLYLMLSSFNAIAASLSSAGD